MHETIMDENIMEGLRSVKGYLGGAVSNYTGECLICDTQELSGDLRETSLAFNDLFRNSHKISKNLKLGATRIMEIHTEEGKIIMGCSGEDARAHLHIFAIFAIDGNTALGKIALIETLSKAMDLFS